MFFDIKLEAYNDRRTPQEIEEFYLLKQQVTRMLSKKYEGRANNNATRRDMVADCEQIIDEILAYNEFWNGKKT